MGGAGAHAGTGEDFKDSMVNAIEEVVGSVHIENVVERKSKNGRYLSVKVVAFLQDGEQVGALWQDA